MGTKYLEVKNSMAPLEGYSEVTHWSKELNVKYLSHKKIWKTSLGKRYLKCKGSEDGKGVAY